MTVSLYARILVAFQFLLIGVLVLAPLFAFCFSPFGVLTLVAGAVVGLSALYAHKRGNWRILPELQEGCELVTHGIYRYVRHPMYVSVQLMGAGLVMLNRHTFMWLVWGALAVVLYLKARREETLWCGHDPRYEAYRARVKRFIPYLF